MKKKQKGEIVTLLTIGTFLVLGVVSLLSTTILKNPQTTKTSAQSCAGENEPITDQVALCCPGLQEDPLTLTCRSAANIGQPTSTPAPITATPQIYTGTNCNNQLDITGACNNACCTQNSDCAANGANQTCSVQNGYCKSGLSCAAVAQGQTTSLYARICGGASNGTCGWQFCNGTKIHDPVRNIDVPCQASQDTAPPPMCQGDSECAQVTSDTCFYLTDEVYYDPGQGFSHNVKFWSPAGGGDGHITLSRNGANTGLQQTPWNRGVYNPFVVPPEYTGGYSNKAETVTFTGTADHCKQGIGSASISCTTGLNTDGKPYIRGASCEAKNFTSTPPAPVALPAANSTPVPTPFSTAFCEQNPEACVSQNYRTNTNAPSVPTPTLSSSQSSTKCSADNPEACTAQNYTGNTNATAPTSTTPVVTIPPTNRCPDDGHDVTCAIGGCAPGYSSISAQCINFWDVCCVKTDSSKNTLLTPTPTSTIVYQVTVQFNLGGNVVQQALSLAGLANVSVCDYYGPNIGAGDIRNCQVIPESQKTQDGSVEVVTVTIPPGQKKVMCQFAVSDPRYHTPGPLPSHCQYIN